MPWPESQYGNTSIPDVPKSSGPTSIFDPNFYRTNMDAYLEQQRQTLQMQQLLANLGLDYSKLGAEYGDRGAARQFDWKKLLQDQQFTGGQNDLNRQLQMELAKQSQQQAQNEMFGRYAGTPGQAQISAALGDLQPAFDKLKGLAAQGGLWSQGQINDQAGQVAGQANQQVAAQQADVAHRMAEQGMYNPAQAAAATSNLQLGNLGTGARAKAGFSWQNAQSLQGILSSLGQIGSERAHYSSQSPWEDINGRLKNVYGNDGQPKPVNQKIGIGPITAQFNNPMTMKQQY